MTFGGRRSSTSGRSIYVFDIKRQKWRHCSTQMPFVVRSNCSCTYGDKIYFFNKDHFGIVDVDALVRSLRLDVDFISKKELRALMDRWWRECEMPPDIHWKHGLADSFEKTVLQFMAFLVCVSCLDCMSNY